MAIELKDKITKLTPAQAAKALASGYQTVVGVAPSKAILDLLLAQWAVETTEGKNIHNYNFGNIKRSDDDDYYQTFTATEVVNGKTIKQKMQWAAYLTPEDGAAAYVRKLQQKDHWWAGLQSGDAVAFNDALSQSPGVYYTAPKQTYLDGIRHRIKIYSSVTQPYSAEAQISGEPVAYSLSDPVAEIGKMASEGVKEAMANRTYLGLPRHQTARQAGVWGWLRWNIFGAEKATKIPKIVPIPARMRRAKKAEITPAVLAFIDLAKRDMLPVGKVQSTVISEPNPKTGAQESRLIFAQTEWFHDNLETGGKGPAYWHPGIAILLPTDKKLHKAPAATSVGSEFGNAWCGEDEHYVKGFIVGADFGAINFGLNGSESNYG